MLGKVLREILTGIDGQSHDLGRYSWLGSFLSVTAIAFWQEARGQHVDLMVLATAHGAIAAAHSAAIFMKRSTEPKPPEEPKQ
jgi:hypothetical protein